MQLTTQATLADLAVHLAGASRVFQRHGLDFCCHGRISLAEACSQRGLKAADLIAEIEATRPETPARLYGEAPLPELIKHLLEHYHAGHRAELPRLLEMARKVERVHGDKAECPRGLTPHLEHMAESLELHMQKEEQILFPHILAGHGRMVAMPISVMEEEHEDHGRNLQSLRKLVTDYQPPACACNTWRALYLGLAELEREIMEHISLENNSLFPRALKG